MSIPKSMHSVVWYHLCRLGETFDESNLVAIPTGAVFVTPANVPHYVWARDGEAIYQESGVGPTGTSFIKR